MYMYMYIHTLHVRIICIHTLTTTFALSRSPVFLFSFLFFFYHSFTHSLSSCHTPSPSCILFFRFLRQLFSRSPTYSLFYTHTLAHVYMSIIYTASLKSILIRIWTERQIPIISLTLSSFPANGAALKPSIF